jgi:4-carboxymuconolactone decarboxylase
MDDERYRKGLQVRREVLGADYVDRQLATGGDAFGEPMQRLATEFCWGTVWTRPQLTRRERSLMNLALLMALGRGAEFRLHVRGALANGLTAEDIREAILHATVYLGMPAGVEATRQAREVLEAEGVLSPASAPGPAQPAR